MDGTVYKLPVREADALIPSLLTLSDVMGTGYHAAVAAHVTHGKTVAVIGDGPVGLCGGYAVQSGLSVNRQIRALWKVLP